MSPGVLRPHRMLSEMLLLILRFEAVMSLRDTHHVGELQHGS